MARRENIDLEEMLANSSELYRHYDSYGRLLYVGVSLSSLGRLADHRSTCSWFKLIKAITIDRYPTRALALAAETAAIKTERPYFNRKHSKNWRNVKLGALGNVVSAGSELSTALKNIAKRHAPKN